MQFATFMIYSLLVLLNHSFDTIGISEHKLIKTQIMLISTYQVKHLVMTNIKALTDKKAFVIPNNLIFKLQSDVLFNEIRSLEPS